MCRYFTVLPTHEEHRGSFQVGEDMHNWATADPEHPKGFARVIAHAKKTLMVMEPWSRPRPPSRVWCLYEFYTTLEQPGNIPARSLQTGGRWQRERVAPQSEVIRVIFWRDSPCSTPTF